MLDVKALIHALVPNRESRLYTSHPLIKLLGAFIVILTLMFCSLEVAVLVSVIVIIESVVGGALRNIWYFFKSLRYILPPIAIILFLLYQLDRVVLILIRLIIGSIAFLNVYATTRLLDMEQALDRIGVPKKLVRALSLSIRLIPLSIRDAEQSVEALSLRGIYRGGFRGAIPLLAIIMANGLDRVAPLTEALVAKYFFAKERKYPWKLQIKAIGILFLVAKIVCFLIAIIGIPIYGLITL